MTTNRTIRVILSGAAAVAFSFGGLSAQSDPAEREQQGQLAARLGSPEADERRQAFYESLSIPPDEVGPELSRALIQLLHLLNGVVSEVLVSGETVDVYENPEFIASVAQRVAEIRDLESVSALARAYYGGRFASEALVEFGRVAVPDLVAVVTDASHYSLIDYGLKTLGLMLTAESGLSASDTESIRDAVRLRLTGPEYFTTVWAAIDVAVRLDDPGLVGIVRELANDANASRARGIQDPEIISMTRERAAKRLRGG